VDDIYTWFKAFHVLAAAIWVGSNLAFQALAIRARRVGHERTQIIVSEAEWYGNRFNLTSSLVIILTAIAMLLNRDISLGDAWVSIALAGWIITFLQGAAFLGPQIKKLDQMMTEDGGAITARSQPLVDRIFLVSRIELVILIIVVFDMVLKPGG